MFAPGVDWSSTAIEAIGSIVCGNVAIDELCCCDFF